MEKVTFKRISKAFPIWTAVVFSLGIISVGIYIALCSSVSFAEFYNNTVSAALRWLLAKISGIANFSIVEMVVFLFPVIIVYAVIFTVRAVRRGRAATARVFVSVLALGALLWVSFVNVYAPGFRAVSVADKLELDTENIGQDELAMTMLYVTKEINTLVAENSFVFDGDGASVLTENYNAVSEKIVAAYDKVNADGRLIQNLKTRVKPIILSEPMTYSHISGVYSFYTGEANVNVNFPDYLVVSTMAHEMAHQRGIAHEDEASFMGYLALISSDDPYLRYCGYMDVYSYLSSALYNSGSNVWSKYRSMLCEEASAELRAYSKFFEKYRDNVVHDVTESVNDTFLKSQGTEGTVAYDLVTELVVAYTVR